MKITRVLFCALLLCATLARAEEAPAASESVPFVRLSVRTVGALEEFAHKTGLATAPHQVADMLAAVFPMVGPKGLSLDFPIVITMLAGEKIQQQQMAFFALPAADTTDFQKKLEEQGVKPESAEHKLFLVRGMPFRFMDHYIVFGGTTDAVKKVSANVLDDTFKDSMALARLEIDAASVRAKVPVALENFIKAVEEKDKVRDENAPPQDENMDKTAGREYGRRLVYDYLKNTLERLTLELSSGEANSLMLNMNVQPFAKRTVFEAPRPEFPAGCVMELHAPYSIAPTEAQLKDLLDISVSRINFAKDTKPETKEATRKAIFQVIELMMSGDAQSVGVAVKDGTWILYGVKQFRSELDFAANIKSLIENIKKSAPPGDAAGFRIDDKASANGVKYSRLVVIDKGKESPVVDFVQRGNSVYFTNITPGEPLSEFFGVKQPNDKKMNSVDGVIDPGAIIRTLAADPATPFFAMEKDVLDTLLKGLGSKKITLTANANEGLNVSLKVPAEILKAFTDEPPPLKEVK